MTDKELDDLLCEAIEADRITHDIDRFLEVFPPSVVESLIREIKRLRKELGISKWYMLSLL